MSDNRKAFIRGKQVSKMLVVITSGSTSVPPPAETNRIYFPVCVDNKGFQFVRQVYQMLHIDTLSNPAQVSG